MEKIAIIGAAYRLPGDIDNDVDLWNALINKMDLVTEVSEERFNKEKFYHKNPNRKGKSYTFRAGVLSDYSSFDYSFFNISAKEAAQMDPQQLLLLETTWRAIENSGCDPKTYRGKKCGVYVGMSSLDFAVYRGADAASLDMYSSTGTAISIAANRISYFFDLNGPSMSIDTACSSSLVALHQACLSIKTGEIETAIVCGVSYLGSHNFFVTQSKANMLSADGRCKSFSDDANGYVRSEGCVVIVLKRFNDALADQDMIQGIILNTGVNSDGKTNGLPMPSEEAQYGLLSEVYGAINFNYSDLSYIEAHGTGTKIGDPIEVSAISRALALKRQKPLPIGSIKSNIGHLEPAAGLAGLIKGLLCIKNRQIPPTIHCSNLNKNINFENGNVTVVRDLYKLENTEKEIVVGVNSFGFGGTNSHAIISEYKQSSSTRKGEPIDSGYPIPVLLTANSEKSLRKTALSYAEFINKNDNLYEIAYNLFNFRARHKFYAIAYGLSKDEIVSALESYGNSYLQAGNIHTGEISKNTGKTALVFSGNGCQWADMGKSILEQSVEISAYMYEVDSAFSKISGYSLIEKIKGNEDSNIYERAEAAQPALFMLQVAILKYLQSYGFKYDAVIGHSVGEVAAALACGALSLLDATKLIYFRSKAQSLTKGYGKMAVIGLDDDESFNLINKLEINESVEIAGINSPKLTTLSGVKSALLRVQEYAMSKDVYFQFLDIDYPFHSRFMDEVKENFISNIGDTLKPQESEVPFISTVYGEAVDGTSLDPNYWWKNLREPVRFRGGIETLLSNNSSNFIEVGAHPILLRSVGQCSEKAGLSISLIPSLHKDSNESKELRSLLFKLLASDFNLNSKIWFPVPASKLRLPGYCWDRKKIVYPASTENLSPINYKIEHPLLGWMVIGNERTWENHIDATNCADLKDHVVGNSIVFPAAGFIEMAIAANSLENDSELGYIEDFQAVAPLVLEDDVTLHTQFKVEINGYFEVRSRPRLTDLDWTIHAKGRIVRDPYCSTIERNEQNCVRPNPGLIVNSADLYESASDIGLKYGEGFRLVSGVELYDNESIAEILTPELYDDKYFFGPSIIDSGLHSAIALIRYTASKYENLERALYLPSSCESIIYVNNKKKIKKALIKLSSLSAAAIKMDVSFYDVDGKVILLLKGFRLNRANIGLQGSELPDLCEYKPLLLFSSDTVAVKSVNAQIFKSFKNLKHNIPARYIELNNVLDSLSVSYIIEGVKKIFQNDFDPNEIYSDKEFGRLYWFLNLLSKEGYLSRRENGIYVWNSEKEILSTTDIFKLLADNYPEALPEALHIARIGMQMDKFLIGEADIDDIVTVKGGLYQSLTRESILIKPSLLGFKDCYNELLAKLTCNQKFNILEIGSGIYFSILTDVAKNNFDLIDYTLLAFDENFIKNMGTSRKPNTDVRLISTKEDFSTITFKHKFNLIICSDLYSLVYKNEALNGIVNFLFDGGILIINEYKPCISHFLLNGLRPYSCRSFIKERSKPVFYSARAWEKTIANLGIDLISKSSDFEDDNLGRFTFIFQKKVNNDEELLPCKKPEGTDDSKSPSALLLHGNDSVEVERISKYMSDKCGGLLLQNYLEESSNRISYKEFDEIFVFPGKEVALEDTRTDFLLMNIAKELAVGKPPGTIKPVLSLLTSGGALCNEREGLNLVRNPKHASLWALMRVISNEYSNYLDTRMIDMQSGRIAENFMELLVHKNEEIIITTDAYYSLRVVPILEREEISTNHENKFIKLELSQKGSLNYLRWIERTRKPLENNQIAIRPISVGLNFRDIMYSLGLIPEEAVEMSSIGPCLGLDVSGIVLEVGQEVTEFKAGDKVMGGVSSSLANYAIADKNALIKLPDSWSYNEGATIFIVFLTAYYSLVTLAGLRKGDKLLVHAGAGGVGIAAIQIANYIGAEVYATVGNEEKRDFLTLLGIKHIYDSRSLYFVEQIMEDTGNGGIDVVLNSLAGEAIHASFKVLKPYGRFIEIGKRDIYENSKLELKPFKNNISYFCVNIEQLMLWRKDLGIEILKNLSELFNDGTFKPLPYILYPSSMVIEALKFLQDGKNIGKVVIDFSRDELTAVHRAGKQKKLNGYYLITGGTSGFGLETAKYLADRGVEGLILLSRSGKIDGEALNYFSTRKVALKLLSVDVTSFEDLKDAFEEIRRNNIDLKGIVHAAAVYQDEMINSMSPEIYERVLFTKIKGACYLDELSRKFELDDFVLYSSATTFFGNIGQANYVAANGFLESLVLKRRASGVKGNYLALGGLKDTGVLDRNARLKRILSEKLGDTLTTSKQALSALGKVLNGSHAGFSVMNFDLLQMEKTLAIVKTSRFDILRFSEKKPIHTEDDSFKDRIILMTKVEAKKELTAIVLEEIANILGINITEIDEKRPLREYGLDSLMGFDLSMSIEKRTRINMSAIALPQTPSAVSIAEMLLAKLLGGNDETEEDKKSILLKKHGEVL